MEIQDKLDLLRLKMKEEGVDACMIPTSDDHNSEYVGDHFKVREFFSGFTGSNGTLVVTQDEAYLWTDGRYFIQAEDELNGSKIGLMKMGEPGVPKIADYITDKLTAGQTFAFNGRTVSANEGIRFEKILSKNGIGLKADFDPAADIWAERPALSHEKIFVISDELAGETAASKISRVREAYKENGADGIIISKLDDIMWLLNIRGSDIECNPVALSYLYMDDTCVKLFIQDDECADQISAEVLPYDSFYDFIERGELADRIELDPANTNFLICKKLEKRSAMSGSCEVIKRQNPTEIFKAVKNETELKNIREVYIRDSAALTRYIFWLKNYVADHKEDFADGHISIKDADGRETVLDEYNAAKILDGMRAQLPGFLDLSFPTIGAFKENGAIVHYEPSPETAKPLKAEGMYLVDSGGQYMGGTTDVTRTIVLGEISEEIRKHYTLTVVGMLRLSAAVFMDGSTGRNVDILARQPLWEQGLDFKHGTGHGIGYILNVHEGPQSIRWKYIEGAKEAVLKAGMIVSDEPGIYITDSHGIRIENILEVVSREQNEYGLFCGFRHLTYVPIDLEAIDKTYMEDRDVKLLNAYHRNVFDMISPYMESDCEKVWLADACREI